MVIYDANGNVALNVEVDDSSVAYKALKGESTLSLKYSLDEHVEIPLGAYCIFEGETYTLMAPEDIVMRHRRYFEYSLIMYTDDAKSKRYMFRNPVDGRLKFPLTATPREHLQMFVDNMNMRDSGWSIGYCEEGPQVVLSYNHTNCHDALTQLADNRELDYWFVGKQVFLGKLEVNKDNPLALSYGGDGQGLKAGTKRVNYSGALPIEVLYTQGSSTNIDRSKYGSEELHLPKSQSIGYDGVHFSDESGYVSANGRLYKTDSNGFYITRADKKPATYSEDSLDCSAIEPTKEITVLDVTEVDAEKHFYDILIYSEFDYNDYVIAGEKATIIFQTGELTGKEFELATDAEGNLVRRHPEGFSDKYWVFEVVPQEIDGFTMPDDASGFIMKRNDTFKVFGIQLPNEYISDNANRSGAEWDMFRFAVKHFYANEDPQYTITGTLDEIYAKRNWQGIKDKIVLGGYVSFYDRSFQPDPVLIRIVGIKRYVNNPYSPEIETSNSVIGSTLVGTLNRIENQEVYNAELHRQGINYTKRRWRDTQETISMLKEAMLEGFTDSLSPITLQTMSLLVGSEALQFRFVSNITNPTPIQPTIRYDKLTKKLVSTGDTIQHMTIGIDSVSNTHAANEYKFWNIGAGESEPTDASAAYYLYIRANKSNQDDASFILSKNAILMEQEVGYYHFLTGILNKEVDDDRSFVSLYGFTEVLPGQITTDIIKDVDSNLVIDLLNATITAKNGARIIGDVTFGENSEGLENTKEWKGVDGRIGDAEKALVNVNLDLENIQNQIDGVVENYFEEGVPTESNYPASTWTDADKANHVGDTYTNIASYEKDPNNAGKSWRWTYTDNEHSGYHWHPIADSDAVKALQEAAKAKSTADGKSRTFVVQPYPPYDKGDLWSQGESGDLMVCKTPKASGSFDASDWVKASSYSDGSNTVNLVPNSSTIRNYMLPLADYPDGGSSTYYAKILLPIKVNGGETYTFKCENAQKLSGYQTQYRIRIDDGTKNSADGTNVFSRHLYLPFGDNQSVTFKIFDGVVDKVAFLTIIRQESSPNNSRNDSILLNNVSLVRGATPMSIWEDYRGDAALENLLFTEEEFVSESTEYCYQYIDLPNNVNGGEKYTVSIDNLQIEGGSTSETQYRIEIASKDSTYTPKSNAITLDFKRRGWGTMTIWESANNMPARLAIRKVNPNASTTARIKGLSLVNGSTPLIKWKENPTKLKNKISEWASDSMFSPTEISGLDVELKRIQDEFNDLNTQWVNFGVQGNGAFSAYNTAYINYKSVLESVIEQYYSSTDKTKAISVPEDFATCLTIYYDRKQTLVFVINGYIKIEIDSKTKPNDWKYLKDAFGQVTEGEVFLANLMGVGEDNGDNDFTVNAFINGSNKGEDATYGKLMITAGIPATPAASDLATRAKNATTRIYEKGKIITNNIEAKGGLIGGVSITEEGLSVTKNGRKLSIDSNGFNYGATGKRGAVNLDACDGDGTLFRIDNSVNGKANYCPYDRKVALMVAADDTDPAIESPIGQFYGLRPRIRRITASNVDLLEIDHTITIYGDGTKYVNLPPNGSTDGSIRTGQEYKIMICNNTATVVIDSGTTKMWDLKAGGNSLTEFTVTGYNVVDIIYDGNNWFLHTAH